MRKQDAHEVCRSPSDTRPLSLKNSDNKLVAGINNHVAKPMLAASAVDIQRGFVPGRQLVANPLELDTFGRWFGAAGHTNFGIEQPRLGAVSRGLGGGRNKYSGVDGDLPLAATCGLRRGGPFDYFVKKVKQPGKGPKNPRAES